MILVILLFDGLKALHPLCFAVLNYLGRLSHAYEQQDLMPFSELAANFKLEKLSRAPARFDQNQLFHWQKEAVMKLTHDEAREWFGEEILAPVPTDKQEL